MEYEIYIIDRTQFIHTVEFENVIVLRQASSISCDACYQMDNALFPYVIVSESFVLRPHYWCIECNVMSAFKGVGSQTGFLVLYILKNEKQQQGSQIPLADLTVYFLFEHLLCVSDIKKISGPKIMKGFVWHSIYGCLTRNWRF